MSRGRSRLTGELHDEINRRTPSSRMIAERHRRAGGLFGHWL